MTDTPKPIKLFIAYSHKDEALYDALVRHLLPLKKSGKIDSWYQRRIVGEKWDQVINEKLETSQIALILLSPDFLFTDYCYGSEIKKAVALHEEGKLDLIPVILRTVDIEGTPFPAMETLPPENKAVKSNHWKNETDAFERIIEGLTKRLKKIINPTDDVFMVSGKKALPNCIKQLSIKNFQCIKNLSLHDIPADTQWVFVTGENGEGKTALLQALTIGILGNIDKEANHLLESGTTRIEIESRHNKKNTIHRLYNKNNRWIHEPHNNNRPPPVKVLGYGVTRLNIMTRDAEETQRDKNPAYSLYHETEGNFKSIETWLKDRYMEDKMQDSPLVTDVKKNLVRLMPNVSSIDIEGSDVYYREKGFEARHWQVSSGSKTIVAMIGDMIKRFLKLHPNVQKVADFSGIVLIDELDLHMHPKWQKKLPGLLSEIFPNIQFWVTTHSFVPFMGAPPRSVFLNLTRSPKEGTEIERLDIDMEDLSPNILISSPLFNLDILTKQTKNPDNFKTHDDWQTLEEYKKIDRELEDTQDEDDHLIKDRVFSHKDQK